MEIAPIPMLPVLDPTVRPQARPRNTRRTRRQRATTDRGSCLTNGWWGHELTPVTLSHTQPPSFRIAFQNINGFNIDQSDEKSFKINNIITNNNIDFLGIQEVNLHLRIMGTQGHWSERNRLFEGFTHCATNQHCNSPARRIFGGTACFMTHPSAHKAITHGHDETHLGRWSWSILRGRNGIKTRIISAYRPVRTHSDEALTVYSQQELYFQDNGGWRDPREAFFEDLDTAIQMWLLAGEQLIIGIDVNEDIRSPDITKWRDKWNMIDALHDLHGQINVATCRSNDSQIPIDTIWSTAGLHITKGGMTGFGSLDLGSADHRMLWIDITQDSMFGFRPPPPQRRPQETLPLHDPRIVNRYNRIVSAERSLLNIPSQITSLEQRAVDGLFNDSTDGPLYDALLAQDMAIRQKAKKECRPFYAGQVLYSKTIGTARKAIHLWDMVISLRNHKRTDTRAIRRLMKLTQIPRALQTTLEEAELARSACYDEYKCLKKDHVQLHEDFRHEICERRATKFGTSVEVQEKIVSNNRLQKNQFRKIQRIMGHKARPVLSSVTYDALQHPAYDAPQHPAYVTHCHTKNEIEQACALEGQRRFSQAENTPFLQGSLLRDLGYLAAQTTVDQILARQYTPEGDVDQCTRDFIDQLFLPPSVASLPMITGIPTTDEYVCGWKKMRSSVASSPFGPLFSDHIAGCDDIRVADIDAAMTAIPLITGYCPVAWQKAVDIMIPKKQSSMHVSKLRIIVLFHATFNMINKTIGRLMVQRADTLGLIPAEAYGSRPGHRSNVCALNKVLTYDILRQQRIPAALCSNDAMSCYDRIVHAIASICMQRLGIAPSTCQLMFGTLQHIQHHVATAFGMSSTHYGGLEIPLQGIGQGNGAGPAIWLIMTIPLINLLRSKGFGFKSTTVLTGETYRFVCYTFVDDTDTIHSAKDHHTPTHTVISEMQQVIDTWEGGLQATGGALSSSKSYWYLVSMQWDQRRQQWRYNTINDTPGQLTIHGNTATRLPLTRYNPDHAEETLGLWIAPNANQQAQVRALQLKIMRWSDQIRTRQLSMTLSWLFLTSGMSLSLRYPLAATNLSKQDCQKIMKPFLDIALPALGLPRSMPHAVLFAPPEYMGYGLINLWLQQAIDQIQVCLDFGHRTDNNITGHLLRDVAESLRFELGLPLCPILYDYHKLQLCTTRTKLHVLWEFCSDSGFSLQDGKAPTPLHREGDHFIMALFLDSKEKYTPKQLAILNRCRLAVQVTMVSDMTTGDGRSLVLGALDRRTPFTNRTNPLWPVTGTPNAHAWRIWRNAIIQNLLPPQAHGNQLRTPLGSWNVIPQDWKWYLDPIKNQVLQYSGPGQYRVFAPTAPHRRTRTATFLASTPAVYVSNLPSAALPTTARGTAHMIQHTGTSSRTSADTLATRCCHPWSGLQIQAPSDITVLIQGILSGTAIAVTDGSFKDSLGTAAFTIQPNLEFESEIHSYIMVNQTPGYSEDMDAYRAELGGIFGIIDLANQLCTEYSLTAGSITVGCDCASALTNITCHSPIGSQRPHNDILTGIRFLLKASPLTWEFHHVRGHQDDHIGYSLLDRWAALNVDMDLLAKMYWHTLTDRQPSPTPFNLTPFPGQWSIWYKEYRLPCWTTKRAQRLFYRSPSELFWTRRLKCEQVYSVLDWSSTALGIRRSAIHQRLWIPKWLCSTLPIGKNLVRWGKPDVMLQCPRCGEDETHRYHVIQCNHAEAVAIRETHIEQLEQFLDTAITEPDLKIGLLTLVSAACAGTPWIQPTTTADLVVHTFQAQGLLGTAYVLDGFFSPTWAITQQAYLVSLGRRTTGVQWMSRVTRRIWQIAWDLWVHRRSVLESTDASTLPAIHLSLNQSIDLAFQTYLSSPNPAPSLARWFARTPYLLHRESIDWKTRWLEMITSASRAP
jgi:exonuclease III